MGYDTQGYGIDEDSNVGLHAYNDDGSLQRFSDVSNAMKKKTTNTGYGLMPSSNRVGPVVAPPIAPDLYSTISQRGGSYNPKTGQYSVGRDSGQTAAESISSDYNAIEPDTMTSTDPAGNPFGMQPHAYPPGLSITEARGPNAGQDFDLRPSGGEQQDYNSYDTILQDNPAHGQWMQDKQNALNKGPDHDAQITARAKLTADREKQSQLNQIQMRAQANTQKTGMPLSQSLAQLGVGRDPADGQVKFQREFVSGTANPFQAAPAPVPPPTPMPVQDDTTTMPHMNPDSDPNGGNGPAQSFAAPEPPPTPSPRAKSQIQITDVPTAAPKPTGKKTVKLMGKTYQVSPQDFDQISAANKSGDQTTVQRIIQNYSGQ